MCHQAHFRLGAALLRTQPADALAALRRARELCEAEGAPYLRASDSLLTGRTRHGSCDHAAGAPAAQLKEIEQLLAAAERAVAAGEDASADQEADGVAAAQEPASAEPRS